MSEIELPSPDMVRYKLIDFLDYWGQNSDYKRMILVRDNGKMTVREEPIEFNAIYDAGNILRTCSLTYEVKEFEGYGGTDWIVFTLLYPPSSSRFGSFLNASKSYVGVDNYLGQIATAIQDGLETVIDNHFPPGCMALLAEPKPHSADVSLYPCRDYSGPSPFYPDAP